MKQGLFVVLALLTGTLSAQEVTPPKFQGANVQRFMARLSGEAEKVAYENGIRAGELSEEVVVRCTIDTAGNVTQWRYLDFNSEGRDFQDVDPATPRTREVLEQALGRLDRWTPAMREGRPVPYRLLLKLWLPVEKIADKQDAEPLLFMGKDPREAFHEWARVHMRYLDNHEIRYEGRVIVTFRIEANGDITILETSEFPDKKLVADIVRIIRKSKGKWTPKRIDGEPVPSEYTYNVHFSGS